MNKETLKEIVLAVLATIAFFALCLIIAEPESDFSRTMDCHGADKQFCDDYITNRREEQDPAPRGQHWLCDHKRERAPADCTLLPDK